MMENGYYIHYEMDVFKQVVMFSQLIIWNVVFLNKLTLEHQKASGGVKRIETYEGFLSHGATPRAGWSLYHLDVLGVAPLMETSWNLHIDLSNTGCSFCHGLEKSTINALVVQSEPYLG